MMAGGGGPLGLQAAEGPGSGAAAANALSVAAEGPGGGPPAKSNKQLKREALLAPIESADAVVRPPANEEERQEVAKWVEERKRHYPTSANVERRWGGQVHPRRHSRVRFCARKQVHHVSSSAASSLPSPRLASDAAPRAPHPHAMMVRLPLIGACRMPRPAALFPLLGGLRAQEAQAREESGGLDPRAERRRALREVLAKQRAMGLDRWGWW